MCYSFIFRNFRQKRSVLVYNIHIHTNVLFDKFLLTFRNVLIATLQFLKFDKTKEVNLQFFLNCNMTVSVSLHENYVGAKEE